MILTYPKVNDDGTECQADVSFLFKQIVAVEQMTKWQFLERGDDGGLPIRRDVEVPIPGCTTIYVAREQFNIKVEYPVFLALWKEHYEMYETQT